MLRRHPVVELWALWDGPSQAYLRVETGPTRILFELSETTIEIELRAKRMVVSKEGTYHSEYRAATASAPPDIPRIDPVADRELVCALTILADPNLHEDVLDLHFVAELLAEFGCTYGATATVMDPVHPRAHAGARP
jgi:hypothetical protein